MVSTAVALGLTALTLVGFVGLGLRASRGDVDSVEDLVVARDTADGRRTTATLVASVMGVWILLSAPEAGAVFGVAAVVGYGVGEAVPMLVYARLGPRIRAVMPEGHSLTEYAYVRYGPAMYGFVVLVSVGYMFVFLAAELTGIALALSLVADVPQVVTATLVGGAVVLYTGYGGLRASIHTDAVQAVLVLPLLALTAVAALVAVGGLDAVARGADAVDPSLLDPTATDGLRFGVALVLAILGAELLNQTWWQRIYAAEDADTLAGGFRIASVLNGAIVLVAAGLGVVAVATTAVETPSVAFFALLSSALPGWVVLGVVLLALALVMSSADSLLNAIASVVTVDLPRVLADPSPATLRRVSRLLTVAVAVAAVVVSLHARSVLQLFLFADLLGAAVAVPLVAGLYAERLSGRGALASSLAGLAVGVATFPFPLGIGGVLRSVPVLGPALPAPDPLYLLPFAGAFFVSGGLTLALTRVSGAEFDHDRLAREVRRLDESGVEPDGGVADESSAEN